MQGSKNASLTVKKAKVKGILVDSNPSMNRHLFQSFYNQLVRVLSCVESFEGILLDNYKMDTFQDPTGAPSKVLFRLVLTYVNTRFKMIIRRKDTNRYGDKAVLALQEQCASLKSVEP